MAGSNTLFEDQRSVSRWLVNLPNRRTRTQYVGSLARYAGYTGSSPDELVSTGQENAEDAHDALKMFYNSLNLASKTKMRMYQSIRSFYRANGITLGKKPITFRASVEYESTRLYSQDEVAMLVDAAGDVRDKAVITFLAQSGQRVGVVTSLRLMHVDVDEPGPIVVEVAGILRNGRGENVNKSQRPYKFAVGEDARRYLELMIQDRAERNEPLEPDSWLFRSYSRRHGDKDIRKVKLSERGLPLSVAQVGNIVRKAAEERGIQRKFGKRYLFHPHGFRRYWKHQLRMGGVDSDLLDYMMGHALPFGGAYDR
jgi:integrase/recombinase XerD